MKKLSKIHKKNSPYLTFYFDNKNNDNKRYENMNAFIL